MNKFEKFVLLLVFGVISLVTCKSIINANEEETVTLIFISEKTEGLYPELEALGIPNEKDYPKGVQIHHIEVPSDEVYSFNGWYYLDNNNQEQLLKKYDIFNDDTTFYAKWVVTPRFVNYELNGGVMSDNPSVIYGNEEYLLNDAQKENHQFMGWYLESDFSGERVTIIPKRSKSLTLYAKFELNQYQVKFLDYDDEVLKTETVTHGKTAKAPTEPDNKEGYHFKEWDLSFSDVTCDLIVKAVYEINTYTVVFKDYDGKTLKTATIDWNNDAISPAEPIRTGYTFNGWDSEYQNVKSDLIITALYKINQYTITFDCAGGSEIAPIKEDYATTIIAPQDPTRRGYNFTGWDQNLPTTMPAEDIIVVALWEVIEYQINYILYEPPVNDPISFTPLDVTYTIESEKITLGVPENRTSATFGGWYDNLDFKGTAITTIPQGSNGNKTYYAKWNARNHTVDFEVKGGTPELPALTVEHSTTITNLPSVSKEGFTFIGWFLESEYLNLFTVNMPVNEDLTLYAKFVSNSNEELTLKGLINKALLKSYQGEITFLDNDLICYYQDVEEANNINNDLTIFINALFNDEDSLLKEIKYQNTNYNNSIDLLLALNTLTIIEQSLSFTLKDNNDYTFNLNYEIAIKKHKIEFLVDDSVFDEKITYKGNKIIKPNNPFKEGFSFLGWYLDEKLFDFNTSISADLTLIAKFQEEEVADTITIAEAKEKEEWAEVVVKGVITGVSDTDIYLEDETAAIIIRGANFTTYNVGDLIKVSGRLENFYNLKQINSSLKDIDLLSSNQPIPKAITINNLNEIDISMQAKTVALEELTVSEILNGNNFMKFQDATGEEITLRMEWSLTTALNVLELNQSVKFIKAYVKWFGDKAELTILSSDDIEVIDNG